MSRNQIFCCPHCGRPALSVASVRSEEEHAARVGKAKAKAAAFAIPLDEVGWSARVHNSFSHFTRSVELNPPVDGKYLKDVPAVPRTLGDLCSFTENDLAWMCNGLGKVSIAEIKETLAEHGLRLGMTESDA